MTSALREARDLRQRAAAPAADADAAAWRGALNEAPLTRSLPEQIAARLVERILAGQYAPAERIREQALSDEFAVSRGPVREALRLLEKDGLVTIAARRGAQVTPVSADELREVFDIRAMLNGLRDRSIAESPAREAMLPAIEQHVRRLADLARDAARGDEYIETVFRLNRHLNAATPNRRLRAILNSLVLQTLRYSQLGLSTPERRRQSAQNWRELVKALRAGDGDTAERLSRQRVIDSRDTALTLLARGAAPRRDR